MKKCMFYTFMIVILLMGMNSLFAYSVDISTIPCVKSLGCSQYSNPVAFYTPYNIYKTNVINQSFTAVSGWNENHCVYVSGLQAKHKDGFGLISLSTYIPTGGITFAYTHAGSVAFNITTVK